MSDELAFADDYFAGAPEPVMSADDYAFDDSYDDELGLDEYDDGPPGLPSVEQLANEAAEYGLPLGYGVEAALAAEQARTDAFWQEHDDRLAYEAHVADAQELAEATEELQRLVGQAGDMYDARSSASSGRLREVAADYLLAAQRHAYDSGDLELLEQLGSDAAVKNAIAIRRSVARESSDRR
jgi:hypothetical protein